MTSDAPDAPTTEQGDVIDAFADALYDVLSARARSWGLMDVGVEVDGWFVDGELLFSVGVDMGFSVDARSGTCAYCELEGEGSERWLGDAAIGGVDVAASAADDEARATAVSAVLDGMLAARRPLLVKVDTPPKDDAGA